MKFISKSSNLLVVLRPGMSASALTGTPAVPTISVRFKDGVAEVEQQELIDMMLAHPAFNGDFISADNVPVDPYQDGRKQSEPAHEVTEMKFGTPIARSVKGGDKPKISKEMQTLIQQTASVMAKEMLPSMVKSTLETLVKDNKKKPRSKKAKKIVKKVEIIEEAVVEPEIAKEIV